MTHFLAILVLASWALAFYTAARSEEHKSDPGIALVAMFTSIGLALAVVV